MAIECTANELADLSKCFAGLNPVQQRAIVTYLLCQIANSAALQPKVYRALLTQTGTNAPVATVLENTLGGTVVWAYDNPGTYTASVTGGFPASKTLVFISGGNNPSSFASGGKLLAGADIQIVSADITAPGIGDDLLQNASIEILVYP